MKFFIQYLLVALGFVFLGLGIAGIFIPLLPTTPFLMLAAFCFFHSSKKLYAWLETHKFLGAYIRSYRKYHAITLRVKITGIALLWISIGFSATFVISALWLRIMLVIIAVAVTIHLLMLRTLTQDMLDKNK